jgi:hypothetical protein
MGGAPAVADAPEGEAYVEFVKELLEGEENRKTAMETRAVAVVTTSGTLS